MLWAGRSIVDVYVGTRRVLLLCEGELCLDDDCGGLSDALARLAAALGNVARRRPLRVWMSAGLCRPFLLPRIEEAVSETECVRIAESTAGLLTGLQDPCRVWLDSLHGGRRLAVAVADETLQQLLKTVAGRPVRSIRPWWSEVIGNHVGDAADAEQEALAIYDCDALTLVVAQGPGYTYAQTYASVQADEEALLSRALIAANWVGPAVPLARLAARGEVGTPAVSGAAVFAQRGLP